MYRRPRFHYYHYYYYYYFYYSHAHSHTRILARAFSHAHSLKVAEKRCVELKHEIESRRRDIESQVHP
jgi:hypothetical protein